MLKTGSTLNSSQDTSSNNTEKEVTTERKRISEISSSDNQSSRWEIHTVDRFKSKAITLNVVLWLNFKRVLLSGTIRNSYTLCIIDN